jgi:anti-sigma regulatory factor (Ser/Thr protein kinase)
MTAAEMNGHVSGPERRAFDAVPASAGAARRFVADLLRLDGAPPAVISDCSLVVSELVTNVIEHSDGSQLQVVLDLADPDWWQLEVAGGRPVAHKQLLAPETWCVAGADKVSGRGLGIVRQLMDDVAIRADDGQIIVRCRRQRLSGR